MKNRIDKHSARPLVIAVLIMGAIHIMAVLAAIHHVTPINP